MKHGVPACMMLAGLLLMGVLVMGTHSLAGAGTDAGAASSARILLTGLLVMGVFGSCSKDPLESDTETGGPKDGTVRMTFDFTQDFMQSITVKAGDAVDENLITDVWVLQLLPTGTQSASPKYINKVDAVETGYRITVDLRAVDESVWFIANTHDANAFKGSFTLDKMQTVFRAITSEADLPNGGTLPMQGVWKGKPGSNGIAETVSLKRSLSKVTLNLSGELPAGDVFELHDVIVKQVPAALYYAHDDDQIAQYPYPALSASIGTVDFAQSVNITYDQNASPEQSFSWLLPENARGLGTATLPTEKTGETAPEGQGDYATYIELVGDYTPAGKGSSMTSYLIYLGADNVKDYNLLRGHAYTVNTVIRGINSADSRIDFIDALDYTDNAMPLFGMMPLPASGNEVRTSYNSDNKANCPKYYRRPGREDLMIAYAYSKALPDARFSGAYITSQTSSAGSGYVWFVDMREGIVKERTPYPSSTELLRCIRDIPSSGGKRYPYATYNATTGCYTIVSRDEDGGVRQEALAAGGGKAECVSPKFEIASSDAGRGITNNAANVACPAGWRLPTQQEAMLITALNIKHIIYLGGSTTYHWFSNSTYYICMIGTETYLGRMFNTNSYANARCVRDVE